LAVASVWISVPLAALTTALAPGHGVLRLLRLSLGWPCWVAVLVSVFSTLAILHGKKSGVFFAAGVWAATLAWGFLAALRFHDAGFGLYLIAVSALIFSWASWTLHELGRSFFDPQLHWFQGLPKPLPCVSCEISSSIVQVSRLDREGAFVFSSRGAVPEEIGPITFLFRDRRINCNGIAVRTLDRVRRRSGVGIQFNGMSADSKKNLGDFVESLKGEGYV
jgi:hypothetical protein